MRSLVYHGIRLGDLLLSVHSFMCIKRKFNSDIWLVNSVDNCELLKGLGIIEGGVDISKSMDIDGKRDGFDMAFIYVPLEYAIITPTNIDIRHIYKGYRKEELLYASRCKQIDGDYDEDPIRCEVPDIYKDRAQKYIDDRKTVVIHPCSSHQLKNIDINVYLRLYEYVTSKGGKTVFVTSKYDDAKIISLINRSINQDNCVHLHGESLLVVSAVISMSSLFIGNDSGIAHLASLLVDNVAIMFRITNPKMRAPNVKNLTIITSDYENEAKKVIDRCL